MKKKTTVPSKLNIEITDLVAEGFLVYDDGVYKLTAQAKAFIAHLDNYFIKAKKKTDIQLMGKDFVDQINIYRETLADYCDMIRDGIDTEEQSFKEKVV